MHQLVDLDVDPLGLVAQRHGAALEPADVAVVVGAEHVHGDVEPALQLGDDVREVAGEVAGLAVRANDHPVLVVAELGRPEPQCAVQLVRVAGGLQPLDRPIDRAVLVQRPLEEPAVELDPESIKRHPDLGDHRLGACARPLLDRRVRGQPQPGGDLGHVLAAVAVLGHLLAARPRHQRRAEQVDLAAGVVEVVLARHVVACEGEQPGQRVAVGGVACSANGDRARRVAGHELHLDPLRVRGRARPIPSALGEDPRDHVPVPGRCQPEVDEPRPGDLGALDPRRVEPLKDPAGDLPGSRPQRLGQRHRDGAGIVAVRRIGRPLQPHRRAVRAERRNRLGQRLGQLSDHGSAHARMVEPGMVLRWQAWTNSPRNVI